jgi:hypothetical protein
MNIGLIILTGIIFILYEKIFNKIYIGKWPPLFAGIIIMFYILFSNFIGLIFSIIYSKKSIYDINKLWGIYNINHLNV